MKIFATRSLILHFKPSILSNSTTRLITLLALILQISLLSGCLKFPFIKNIEQHLKEGAEKDINSNIKITSLRIPQKGERVEIIDPDSEKVYSVILGEVFTAASGKICSDITISEEDKDEKQHGLACLNDNREWDKNKLDIEFSRN